MSAVGPTTVLKRGLRQVRYSPNSGAKANLPALRIRATRIEMQRVESAPCCAGVNVVPLHKEMRQSTIQAIYARAARRLPSNPPPHPPLVRPIGVSKYSGRRIGGKRKLIAALDHAINPPLESEPEIIYVSEDEIGSPRLGSPDFNPKLFAKPLSWW